MTPHSQSSHHVTSDASGHTQSRNNNSVLPGIKEQLFGRDEDPRSEHPGAFKYVEEPTYVKGSTVYLDGSVLSRPFSMPNPQKLIAAIFVVIALVISGIFASRFISDVIYASAKVEAEVQEVLAQEVSYDLPNLMSLAPLSDSNIVTTLVDSGYTLYDANADDEDASGLRLIKFPSSMDSDEASAYYLQGVSNLSSREAVTLLYGMWQLTTDRSSGMSIRVRYADFTSGSVEEAVQNAMVDQGLDATTLGDSGVDSSGNTYQAGTVTIDDTTYTWQVSACALSSVYDVDGLPDTACYVGIRIYY